jgi:serine/threonine protein kinase
MDQRDVEKSSVGSLAALFAMAFEDAAPIERQMGEYRLMEKLGEGGMGTVYRALHTELDRVVAIKVLRPGRIDPQEASARFTREIKLAGQLDHPNIVRAHDARRIGDVQILVMEYIDGVDLQTLSERCGPIAPADACELVRQAALGLQCAHEHGLIHRDIKPSNLMLGRNGQVKILDLGLARLTEQNAADWNMTVSGQMMGTPDFIAPEQVHDSRRADIRSDIYSLGCTFFKLLTGHVPFSGLEYQTLWQKLSAHVERPLPPLDNCRGEISHGMRSVLDRMTAKNPDERFGTPGELAEALAEFTAGCDLRRLVADSEGIPPAGESLRTAGDTAVAVSGSTPQSHRTVTPAYHALPRDNRRRRWWIFAGFIFVLAVAAVWGRLVLMNRWNTEDVKGALGKSQDASSATTIKTQDASSTLPGWIVLSWTRAGLGKPHLWLTRPDGTGRFRITNDPKYFDIHPKFSPDGRRIAFIRGSEANSPNELWICNTDGGDCRQIVAAEGKSERLASPVWVSNTAVCYVRDPVYNRQPDLEVWRIDLDEARPRRLFRFIEALGKRSGLLTDASPDGRQLAVIAPADARSSGSDVFTCDLNGGGVRKVWTDTGKDYSDGRALWSPDGRRIAWHHNFTPPSSDGQTAIHYGVGIATLEQGGVWAAQLQTDQTNFVTPLAWSPDGKVLLCARIRGSRQRTAPASFFCMNPQFGVERECFELDVSFWQPAERDLGRLADWAVVPADAVPTFSTKANDSP